ncbi:glycosyl transferase, group 1 [Syntrophobacter fumaroxidans MPOB]|uniref:Glycosyl transferase, group 1 n=1 Tax=Syntrophobacter fumaroxidans (strain DSM 10017 / MPOB) TaxID=335543 RepID=A0LNL2_SYNFM|nr:glycosyl transferase, group 1 [Syntrophobacter fumaroxidans MPOB]
MRLLVAQIGARRHYAVPRVLHGAGMLDRLVTDACGDLFPWSLADLVPAFLRRDALSRLAARSSGLPRGKVTGLFIFTVSALLGPSRRKPGGNNISWWLHRNRRFNELVIGKGFGSADGVYVFNGAGLEVLKEAKRLGLFRVLDQTSAPMRHDAELLISESERWPDWSTEADSIYNWLPMAEREEEEWQLADRIICGSEYVAEGIRVLGGPAKKSRVVPYPCDHGMQPPATEHVTPAEKQEKRCGQRSNNLMQSRTRSTAGLHILFAGTLNLRKGLPYLHEAIRLFGAGRAKWRIVGPPAISRQALAMLGRVAEVRGAVPRSEMVEHYAWADILVLPTISEGSANVCYEALARAVPVITTPNAGSIVRDMIDGFIVPVRSPASIAEKLALLEGNPSLLQEMSLRALERSREFTVNTYAFYLENAIKY